jgi:hypothetical protein
MDRQSLEAALDALTGALEHLDRAQLFDTDDRASRRLVRAWHATDIAVGLVTDLLEAWS